MSFIRAVLLGPAFLMLICSSESKPQNVDTSHLPDNTFLDILEQGGTEVIPCPSIKQSTGSCSCVPLIQCCGQALSKPGGTETNAAGKPILEGIVDDRLVENRSCRPFLVSDRFIINVEDRQNAQCNDALSVCCETSCETPPQPTTIVPPISSKPPIRSGECGIRNQNGVGVTINGFEGSQAQLGEFPWMVAVLDKATNYVGGGSLVHPRVILTAAHKVNRQEARNLVARIGDWDLSTTNELIANQNINVERILFHPGYDKPTFVNNVALLILENDATLGSTVMPICLPDPGQKFDNAGCIVTGWGKDVFGSTGRYQMIMKEVHVPAVSHNECQRMLRNTRLGSDFNLHNTFNCAGGNGEDACTGDGGSPLVCPDPSNPNRYVQMGVVSWGIGCNIVGNPGVYGSIPATVEWISRAIQDEVVQGGFDIRNQPVTK